MGAEAPLAIPLFAVPLAVWAVTAGALLFALRRGSVRWAHRLAALFAGGWAVIATTAGVIAVTAGGWGPLLRVASSPDLLLTPPYLVRWSEGMLGATLLFGIAFLLNQLLARGLLRATRGPPLPWPEGLPSPATATSLMRYSSERPDAFSFTLLERAPGRWVPRRREVILLSDGLIGLLPPEELEAVVAHEAGHVHDLDTRYLTFFRTFARMLRWDPLLAYLASALSRREEYQADLEAVRLTGRPLALARALFRVLTHPSASAPARSAPGLLGAPGSRSRRDALRRIERLIELAEHPESRENRSR